VAKVGRAPSSKRSCNRPTRRSIPRSPACWRADRPDRGDEEGHRRPRAGDLINETVLAQEMEALRLRTPDAAIAEDIAALPQFQGPGRQVQPAVAASGPAQCRAERAALPGTDARELGAAPASGHAARRLVAPDTLARPVFAFQNERRSAELVNYPSPPRRNRRRRPRHSCSAGTTTIRTATPRRNIAASR